MLSSRPFSSSRMICTDSSAIVAMNTDAEADFHPGIIGLSATPIG
jgi:hypothetical protein